MHLCSLSYATMLATLTYARSFSAELHTDGETLVRLQPWHATAQISRVRTRHDPDLEVVRPSKLKQPFAATTCRQLPNCKPLVTAVPVAAATVAALSSGHSKSARRECR
eukprot:SAG11_NODE_2052_length_3879_cov_2.030159_4_plen_109_part_00